MFEEAISLLSIWASMNSWLTPTVLFLLLNLMIGTIAVTSGFTSHKPSHHHNHPEPIFHQHHNQQPPPQIQSVLTRSPSVLQRLKSFNFSALYSQSSTSHLQELHPQQPEPTSEPQELNPPTPSDDDNGADETPTLDEIYSRIKQASTNPSYGRQNSDTKPSGGEIPVKLPKKMKKSASDMSAFNHFHFEERENAAVEAAMEDLEEEEEEIENAAATVAAPVMVNEEREDRGVDAKADDFINNFRKQLQMQRNESIVRYKEIISRTSAQ